MTTPWTVIFLVAVAAGSLVGIVTRDWRYHGITFICGCVLLGFLLIRHVP